MSDYDFSTLNDKEFEELVRDILNVHFELDLRSFKAGRDGGIDLRFSTQNDDNSLIVQAKHYRLSGISRLVSDLKTHELPKVKTLKPKRYILATSLPLSPQDQTNIRDVLSPYIINVSDVIGKEAINQFLGLNPETEKRHFKLWLSSSNLLLSFLNNAVVGRSGFALDRLVLKMRLFVPCKKLELADSMLAKNKVLLITGQPGVGKTTLSEILLLDRVKKGFDICYVSSVQEAENVISPDVSKKQLFYLDDFLGSNYFELRKSLSEETSLTHFIERIRNTPNKYLLLSTRTVFLNHAIDRFEKVRRSGIGERKFELHLDDYSELDKAKILYNHLYFSDIPSEFLQTMVKDRFYWRVIRHKNFVPRLIEFFTKAGCSSGLTPEKFREEVIKILENPAETWGHAFDEQIEESERSLLFTLLSFTGGVDEATLRVAFSARQNTEKDILGRSFVADQFEKSVKVLQDAFINIEAKAEQQLERTYSFVNPSVADFLALRLRESLEQRRLLISSSCYKRQLLMFDPEVSQIPCEVEFQNLILDKLITQSLIWSQYEDHDLETNSGIIAVLNTLITYCKLTYHDEFLFKCFSRLDFSENLSDIFEIIEYVGQHPERLTKCHSFVTANFGIVIAATIQSLELASDEEKAWRIPDLFDYFDQNYWIFMLSSTSKSMIQDAFKRVYEDLYQSYVLEQSEDSVDIDEVRERYENLDTSYSLLEEYLFRREGDFAEVPRIDFDEEYWSDKVLENQKRWENLHSVNEDSVHVSYENSAASAIDDLFSRLVDNSK